MQGKSAMGSKLKCSSGNRTCAVTTKQLVVVTTLLLSSVDHLSGAAITALYPRQTYIKSYPYSSSNEQKEQGILYPATSNLGTYSRTKKYKNNPDHMYPDNDLQPRMLDIGYGVELAQAALRRRKEYLAKEEALRQTPNGILQSMPDSVDLLKRLLESGLLRIAFNNLVVGPNKQAFSKLHRDKNLPRGRLTAINEQFNPEKRRGSGGGCLFHAGLAHNCDYKDLIGAIDETDHWGSDIAPGKRRRKKRSVNHKPREIIIKHLSNTNSETNAVLQNKKS